MAPATPEMPTHLKIPDDIVVDADTNLVAVTVLMKPGSILLKMLQSMMAMPVKAEPMSSFVRFESISSQHTTWLVHM